MNKIKIFQINKYYFPLIGGVETVVKQIAERVNSKTVAMQILCVHENKGIPTQKVKIRGVSVIKTRQNFIIRAMPFSFDFFSCFLKLRADLWHFHHPFPLAVLAALIFRPRGKWIVTYHSDIVKQKILNIFFNPFLLLFLAKCEAIVVTSPNLIESSGVLFKFKSKCFVIPLGLQVENYKIKQPLPLSVPKAWANQYLLAVGRFVGYKGFEYLIRSLNYLSKNENLILVGSGPQEFFFRKIINKYGLEDRVLILGPLCFEELTGVYRYAKYFAFPSVTNNEAFGLVQLEAMLMGKPVISTDLKTGVTFVNQNFKSGLVVSKRSSLAIAKAVKYLNSHPELVKSIRLNNPRYVKTKFNLKNMINGYERLYRQLGIQ